MKTFTKILSVLLAAMMLISLVACDKPGNGEDKSTVPPTTAPTEAPTAAEEIIGKWEGKLADKAMESVLGEMEMDIDLETEVIMFFEFGEDGKGKMTFDEATMKAFTVEVAGLTLEMMAEAFEITVEEMLAEMEMTKEEYLEMAAEEMDTESLESAVTYTIEGEKLTITDELGEKTEITFAFENGDLVMKDAKETGSEELLAAMFPMTLKRVK